MEWIDASLSTPNDDRHVICHGHFAGGDTYSHDDLYVFVGLVHGGYWHDINGDRCYVRSWVELPDAPDR